MRTFIAIELEEEVKDHLAEVQAETQKLCRRGNFTPKDNFHLTLHFLGEIEEDDIEYLQDAMYETARRNRPFTLTLDKIGFFPRGNKGIMWAGLERSTAGQSGGVFSAICKELKIALDRAGFCGIICIAVPVSG